MKNKENTLLATPYLVWMCGFIVIPLALVIYYAFTTKAGAFTLENVGQILLWENYKPLVLALLLSFASTVLCFVFLCGIYFYSSHVDEFPASDSCLADFTREKRSAERDFAFFASTKTEPHQYSLCHYSRHGL